MKKTLIILLAITMCLLLCACIETDTSVQNASAEDTSTEAISETEATESEVSEPKDSSSAIIESEEDSIAECEHDYKLSYSEKATCTESGNNTYCCAKCAVEYSEEVPANGHDWKSATCKAPKTCKDCGETSGSTGEHVFNGSTCTICGKSNYSSETEIAQALKKIERYVKYIEINKGLIANEYDLYCLSGDLRYFNDAHEHTLEINDYLKKVMEIFKDINTNHYFVKSIPEDCQECILSMPTVPSNTSSSSIKSYIRKCSNFAEKADRIFVVYENLCETFGA